MSDNRLMGVIYGLPFDEYLAVDAFSSSAMRDFARSPWHYKNRVPLTPTKPMLSGTLAHCATLEPNALAGRYLICPDNAPRRPTAAQWGAKNPSETSQAAMAWWRDFEAQAKNREIISADTYGITQAQVAALKADPYISEILRNGEPEVSVFWIDKKTGVYCKARPDMVQWLGGGRVRMLELKTTADESPDGFSRVLTNMGYHRARSHYISGYEHASGYKVEEYVFAVVTSAPPVLAVPYLLDDEDAQQGEDECAELLDRFAWCTKENEWPAYGSGPQLVGLKKWAKRSSEIEVGFVE